MSTDKQLTNEDEVLQAKVEESTETAPEVIPSMDDFKDQLDQSFKKIQEGDILKGTVIGITDTEVTVDLGYYTEGIIKLEELSNDPRFSIKADITLGEEVSAVVLSEDDGHGNILLSRKRADDILAWERLTEDMENRSVHKVKIAQAVNGGVVTYLYGVRAFIPASQLSIAYVEDLQTWVGREVDVIVITASAEDKKLILSGKEVEKDRAIEDRNSKIRQLQLGLVTKGTVEKIVPYGAFVNIGDGLTGLVHISQICGRRIKSPNEVIKEGEEVTVKITDLKDGKISLSMKAVEEKEDIIDNIEEVPFTYTSGGEATTGLADLLKNIKL
ncbi:MAG: S1 RNA-binding domain-containing protein [Clostridiales bacterium]|nr:S1 RNA-binding domain-containing protein [Clostridiales bacterium]